MLVFCVEAIIYLLLYNLHDYIFKSSFFFFYLFMHCNKPALNLVELEWGENLQKQCFPYSRENIARRQSIFVLHMWEKKSSSVKQQTNKQILKIQRGTTKNQPVISGSLILVMSKKPLQKIFFRFIALYWTK